MDDRGDVVGAFQTVVVNRVEVVVAQDEAGPDADEMLVVEGAV